MKTPHTVVVVHGRYQFRGGEDEVFEAETRLLEERGHRVIRLTAEAPNLGGFRSRAHLALNALWSGQWYKRLRTLLADQSVDVLHIHNFFPVISPSVFYACNEARVPVVQTLHNFRLICPAATLYRAGQLCERCVGRPFAWPAIWHGCCRGSRSQSAVVAAMLGVHRLLGTWQQKVDLYVALTQFARDQLVRGGLPPDRVTVKPNFVHPDPGMGGHGGGFALYVGRLYPEKGINTLLPAWRKLGAPIPLKVIGEGPLSAAVAAEAGRSGNVAWLGRRSRAEMLSCMQQANFLLVPAAWYEPFGLVAIEAFSTGLPVIVSGHGGLAEIVEPGRNGLHFRPGDAADLAAKVEWAWSHPQEMVRMGQQARRTFEQKYTAEHNYGLLMEAYRAAIARARRLRPAELHPVESA